MSAVSIHLRFPPAGNPRSRCSIRRSGSRQSGRASSHRDTSCTHCRIQIKRGLTPFPFSTCKPAKICEEVYLVRVAIVEPPFISVAPRRYGGTELFIAQLAAGLQNAGIDVVVYANGESTVDAETRWLFPKAQWPIKGDVYDNLRDLNHTTWAIKDASRTSDL